MEMPCMPYAFNTQTHSRYPSSQPAGHLSSRSCALDSQLQQASQSSVPGLTNDLTPTTLSEQLCQRLEMLALT
eukprot:4409570-Amphidinium_carterae.2